MDINLATLARDRGIRRKRVKLRPISPTRAQENDLYAIYAETVAVWSRLFSRIAAEYSEPSPITTDADGGQLTWLVDQAAREADTVLFHQTDQLGRWVRRMGTVHTAKTISSVRSALGVDIEPFMRLSDIQSQLDEAISANVSLISSVNAKNRATVEEIIRDGLVNRRTKKEVTARLADALGVTKRRARLIANDQTYKLNLALSAFRNAQLGIEFYEWKHLDGQKHPRKWHVSRDGKLFRWDSPPWDGLPGYQPNCHCLAVSVLDLT